MKQSQKRIYLNYPSPKYDLSSSQHKRLCFRTFISLSLIVLSSQLASIPIETPHSSQFNEIPGEIANGRINFQEDGSPILHIYQKLTDEFQSYTMALPAGSGPISFTQTADTILNPNGTHEPYKIDCIRSLEICHSSRSFSPARLWLVDMRNHETRQFYSVFRNQVSYTLSEVYFEASQCSDSSSYCYFLINFDDPSIDERLPGLLRIDALKIAESGLASFQPDEFMRTDSFYGPNFLLDSTNSRGYFTNVNRLRIVDMTQSHQMIMKPLMFEILEASYYWFQNMVKVDGSPNFICSNEFRTLEMFDESDLSIIQSRGPLEESAWNFKKFENFKYFVGTTSSSKMIVVSFEGLQILKYLDMSVGRAVDLDSVTINSKNYLVIFTNEYVYFKGYMLEMTDLIPTSQCSIQNCEVCNGDRCTLCQENYYYLNNTCLESCPLSHKIQIPKSRIGEARCASSCSDITYGCISCTDEGVCLACSKSMLAKNYPGVEQTGLKFYQNSCWYSCPENTTEIDYGDNTGTHCILCHPSCHTCQTDTEFGCTSCIEPFKFKNGICVEECGLYHYYNSTSVSCGTCPIGCEVCQYDPTTLEVYCQEEMPTFSLIHKLYFAGSESVILEFDDRIDKDTTLSSFKANLNETSVNITSLEFYNDHSLQLFLDLEQYSDKDNKYQLSLSFEHPSQALFSSDKIYFDFPIKMQIALYVTKVQEFISENPGLIKTSLMAVVSVFLSNASISAHLHRFISSLKFLGLINISLPNIVLELTSSLDPFDNQLLDSIFNTKHIEDSCQLHPIFRKNNIHCFGFKNTKTEYGVILLLLFAKLFLFLVGFCFRNEKKSENSIWRELIKKINQGLSISFIISIMTQVHFKVVLGTLVALYPSKASFSGYTIIQFFLIFLLFLYYIFFSIMIFGYMIKSISLKNGDFEVKDSKIEPKNETNEDDIEKNQKNRHFKKNIMNLEDQEEEKVDHQKQNLDISKDLENNMKISSNNQLKEKVAEEKKIQNSKKSRSISSKSKKIISKINQIILDILKGELRPKFRKITVLYLYFNLIKDIAISVVLIFGQNYPILQLLLCLIFFLADLIYLSVERPHYHKKSNILEIFNSAVYTLLLFVFCLIYFFDALITPGMKELYFGYPIIILLCLSLLGNIMIGMVFTIKSFIIYCSSSKKEKNKNKVKSKSDLLPQIKKFKSKYNSQKVRVNKNKHNKISSKFTNKVHKGSLEGGKKKLEIDTSHKMIKIKSAQNRNRRISMLKKDNQRSRHGKIISKIKS